MIIKNAQIVNTYLGEGGRFMLAFRTDDVLHRTFMVDFLSLASSMPQSNRYNLIDEILRVVNVSFWEELAGQYVRIKRKDDETLDVAAIGNILYDSWLDFSHYESIKECQVERASDRHLGLSAEEEVATNDEV